MAESDNYWFSRTGTVDQNLNTMQNKNQYLFYNQNKQVPGYGYPSFVAYHPTEHSNALQSAPTSVTRNSVVPHHPKTVINGQYSTRELHPLFQTGQVQLSQQTSMQIHIGGQQLIEHKSTQNYAFNTLITPESLNGTNNNDTNYVQRHLDQTCAPTACNMVINRPITRAMYNVPTYEQFPHCERHAVEQKSHIPNAIIANQPPKYPIYNTQNGGKIYPQNVNSNFMHFEGSYKHGMIDAFIGNTSHRTQIERRSVNGDARLPVNKTFEQNGGSIQNGNAYGFPTQQSVNLMTSNIFKNTQLQNANPTKLRQMMVSGSMPEYQETYKTGKTTLEYQNDPLSNISDTNKLHLNIDSRMPYNNLRNPMAFQYDHPAPIKDPLYACNEKEEAVISAFPLEKREGEIVSNEGSFEKGQPETAKLMPSVENKIKHMINATPYIVERQQKIGHTSKQKTIKSTPSTDEGIHNIMEITSSIGEEQKEMIGLYRNATPTLDELDSIKRKNPIIDLDDSQNQIISPKRQRTEKKTELNDQSPNKDLDSFKEEIKVSELSDMSLNSNTDSCIEEKYVNKSVETDRAGDNVQETSYEEKNIKSDKRNCFSRNSEEDVRVNTSILALKDNEYSKKVLSIASIFSTDSDKNDTENTNGDEYAIEKVDYSKPSIQRNKSDSNKNINHLMDVLCAPHPRFLIFFHGQNVLCMSKQNKKYMLLRELIFYFFKDRIKKVQSCIKELRISKILLTGKEKDDVSKYLFSQKVFTDKSVKHVGIIPLEDANRLYHKLFPDRKCDVCVKVSDIQSFVKVNTDTVIDITGSDDEDDHMNIKRMDQGQPIEDKLLGKLTTVSNDDDQDSDTTIPYVEDEANEKSLVEHPDNEELITAGVMELAGNLLRYVIRCSKQFVPIKDLNEIFCMNVINKTVEQICCEVTKCSEIEARYFQQFDIGFCEIVPCDTMVDSEILEHIYIVASLMEVGGVKDENG